MTSCGQRRQGCTPHSDVCFGFVSCNLSFTSHHYPHRTSILLLCKRQIRVLAGKEFTINIHQTNDPPLSLKEKKTIYTTSPHHDPAWQTGLIGFLSDGQRVILTNHCKVEPWEELHMLLFSCIHLSSPTTGVAGTGGGESLTTDWSICCFIFQLVRVVRSPLLLEQTRSRAVISYTARSPSHHSVSSITQTRTHTCTSSLSSFLCPFFLLSFFSFLSII